MLPVYIKPQCKICLKQFETSFALSQHSQSCKEKDKNDPKRVKLDENVLDLGYESGPVGTESIASISISTASETLQTTSFPQSPTSISTDYEGEYVIFDINQRLEIEKCYFFFILIQF